MRPHSIARKPLPSVIDYDRVTQQEIDDATATYANEQKPSFAPPNKLISALPTGWPSEPSDVQTTTVGLLSDLLVNVSLLIASITFLAFAIVVRAYDGKPINSNPRLADALQNATQYGPTVFPLLFACVLSRAAHAILMWRLEKGERIGVLDILAGSTSLTSTVISQLQLGLISTFGLVLLILWALSPIGGQASLRLVGERTETRPSQFTLKYRVPNGDLSLYDHSDRATDYGIASNNFVAALSAPEVYRTTDTDLWGSVKIPILGQYEAEPSSREDLWYAVESTGTEFVSWIGIPTSLQKIQQAHSNDDFSFNMESSYIDSDCVFLPYPYGINFTIDVNPEDYNASHGNGFVVWMLGNNTLRRTTSLEQLPARQILFKENYNGHMYKCTLTTVYVKSHVSCTSMTACRVVNVRRSQLLHPPAAFTLLDNYSGRGWSEFARNFIQAVPSDWNGINIMTAYILKFSTDSRPENGDQIVSKRLGQMVNTYLTSLYLHSKATKQVETNETGNYARWPDTVVVDISNIAETTATRTSSFQVIDCRLKWMITLSVASLVLIVAALIPPAIRYFVIKGPDILLNFSNLAIRDNPYVELPTSGSFLDGSSRASLLKDHRVRLGDAKEGASVGMLVIGSSDNTDTAHLGRIRRGRLYH